jgi:hypothetical protein
MATLTATAALVAELRRVADAFEAQPALTNYSTSAGAGDVRYSITVALQSPPTPRGT